jgi:hypothetical protein
MLAVYLSRHPEKMKISHEETKGTKKDQKKLRVLRFFVVDFWRRRL